MIDQEDARVRAAAFAWLEEQVERHPYVLPRSLLAEGFVLGNIRVPLVGPQGILPRQTTFQPARELVEIRYQRFRASGEVA